MTAKKKSTRGSKPAARKARARRGRLPESAAYLKRAHSAVRPMLSGAASLPEFLKTAGKLTLDERRLLVEQALLLLEMNYVHLPLKRAMHAVDPIQRLKLLQYRLAQTREKDELPSEAHFHNEMTNIFNSARDLHTIYLLPAPFNEAQAVLPFLIEEYFEGGQRKHMLSKWMKGFEHETFRPGVEILHWNGVPIERAVELNGERQAGSNLEARRARGLDALTIRPLSMSPPPDEEWVVIRYRTDSGEGLEIRQDWIVTTKEIEFTRGPGAGSRRSAARGIDLQTSTIQKRKKALFAPDAVAAEKKIATTATVRAAASKMYAETCMPGVFGAREVKTPSGTFAYIRIFTFDVEADELFVREFLRLLEVLPQNGLIVDVRGNGGGLIPAGERLLQLLTPHVIEPERVEFVNTPINLEICRGNAPSALFDDFDLSPWLKSIEGAVQTGATYSLGFPITSVEQCNDIGQKYYGPVVLIVDALCYSTTDIFAAGFQDHNIGPILGTSLNTGAGGANVWEHCFLRQLMKNANPPYGPYKELPNGADMTVAVRRTLRVGERSGTPVEDIGVVPTHHHPLTKNDLLDNNADLIAEAAKLFKGRLARKLSVEVGPGSDGTRYVIATTENISRLDVYLDGRPLQSFDVRDGTTQFPVALPAPGESVLELQGFSGGQLVASCRRPLS